MSNTARAIIASRTGASKPSLKDIVQKVIDDGLTIESNSEERFQQFELLVALVGLQRAGDLDVERNIRALTYLLLPAFAVDGTKVDPVNNNGITSGLWQLLDESGIKNEAEVRNASRFLESLVSRINKAYDELCGPQKTTPSRDFPI